MKKQSGSTLIELVVYMGLLGIFLVIMTNLFVSILDVRLNSQSNSALQQDGRFIINRIHYDVRRAKQIITPLHSSASASMELVVDEGGVDTTLIYTLDEDKLMLSDPSGQNQLNGPDTKISDLNFTRIGNSDSIADAKDSIQITFTLTGDIIRNSGVESENFRTTVTQR